MVRRCPVRTSAFVSPYTHTKMVPQLGHDYALPNASQFVIQLSSCHQHSIASDIDSVENEPCKMKLPPCSQHRPTSYCLLRLMAKIISWTYFQSDIITQHGTLRYCYHSFREISRVMKRRSFAVNMYLNLDYSIFAKYNKFYKHYSSFTL